MAPELTIAENYSTQSCLNEAASRPRWLERARVVAAILFVAALFVPLVGASLHLDPVPSFENRAMARLPDRPRNFKQFSRYSDLFLAYYRDHFGLRNTLIRGLSLVKFHGGLAFDRGTNIIMGKDGWLFYPKEPGDFLADRNLDPFTSGELDIWQQILERRQKFCADHEISFIVVIPPDKQTVYPELLPADFSIVGPKSRLDQLIDRLRETHSPVDLIDLRPILSEAKKYHRIYFKTDTHWNDLGAYAAYPVILDEVNRVLPGAKLRPQSLSNFTLHSSKRSGDLAYFLNLYYEYNEEWPTLNSRIPFPMVGVSDTTHGVDPRAPSLFMIHDSFTGSLYQLLGPDFSRVRWEWTTMMNGPEVLSFKPDVVIDEFVERMLFKPTPVDTPDVLAEKAR
jgi:alginate O-acetyltransferase complex protein AlgJ